MSKLINIKCAKFNWDPTINRRVPKEAAVSEGDEFDHFSYAAALEKEDSDRGDEFRKILTSFRKRGQIAPVIVTADNVGIDGYQRYLCALLTGGEDSILVAFQRDETAEEIRAEAVMDSAAANVHRAYTLAEIISTAEALRSVCDTAAEAADVIGISEGEFSSITALPERVSADLIAEVDRKGSKLTKAALIEISRAHKAFKPQGRTDAAKLKAVEERNVWQRGVAFKSAGKSRDQLRKMVEEKMAEAGVLTRRKNSKAGQTPPPASPPERTSWLMTVKQVEQLFEDVENLADEDAPISLTELFDEYGITNARDRYRIVRGAILDVLGSVVGTKLDDGSVRPAGEWFMLPGDPDDSDSKEVAVGPMDDILWPYVEPEPEPEPEPEAEPESGEKPKTGKGKTKK